MWEVQHRNPKPGRKREETHGAEMGLADIQETADYIRDYVAPVSVSAVNQP